MESTDLSSGLVDSALLDANLIDSTVVFSDKPKLSVSKTHQLNTTFTPSPPAVDASLKKVRWLLVFVPTDF